MNQMVLFQMEQVLSSEIFWISSYGAIFDDSGMILVLDLQDFLKNGSNDFANFGNLDEPNGSLSYGAGPMFWKVVDLELWSDL